jgi:hypothetical protein
MASRVTLQRFLKDADERVRQACADALNNASKELEKQIQANMSAQGIHNRTGRLRGSIKSNLATANKPVVVIKSEVYAQLPKKPNKNRRLWGKGNIKYSGRGVPYGRIIEFSPRINKPFFYPAWYKYKKQIREYIIRTIGEAWNNG